MKMFYYLSWCLICAILAISCFWIFFANASIWWLVPGILLCLLVYLAWDIALKHPGLIRVDPGASRGHFGPFGPYPVIKAKTESYVGPCIVCRLTLTATDDEYDDLCLLPLYSFRPTGYYI